MKITSNILQFFSELDAREQDYRFDLDKDIPWDESFSNGNYIPDEFFDLFGFNRDLLNDPAVRPAIEWCWALAICQSFIYFEKDVVRLIGDKRNKIPLTKSSQLLLEEEMKHIKLFERLASKLESTNPEWVSAFKEAYRNPITYTTPFDERSDLESIEQHQFLIWLFTLFFEDYTIYLHDKIEPFKADLQKTWFESHACHRREEEEHVRTDEAYLKSCHLNQQEMRALSKEFFFSLYRNYQTFFCLDTCTRFLAKILPGETRSLLDQKPLMELPFFEDLLHHPVFARTRNWIEVLREDMRSDTPKEKPKSLMAALENAADSEESLNFVTYKGEIETISYSELLQIAKSNALKLIPNSKDKKYILLYFADIRDTLVWFWSCLFAGKVPVILAYNAAIGEKNEETFRLQKIGHILKSSCLLSTVEGELSLRQSEVSLPMDLLNIDQVLAQKVIGTYESIEIRSEQEALIQFSSGSTGDPKGISLSHHNIISNAYQMMSACSVTDKDRFLNWMPLHHDMGMIGFHLTPIIGMITQYQISHLQFMKSPSLWPTLVGQHQITFSGFTNTAFKNLVRWARARERKGYHLDTIRSIVIGAEPIQRSNLEDVIDSLTNLGLDSHALTPAYGMAEASLGVTFKENGTVYKSLGLARQSLSIGDLAEIKESGDAIDIIDLGYPVHDLSIKIVDTNGEATPDGFVGYVSFKGPNVSRGYWNREGFQPTLDEDGWFVTGDLGFLRGNRLHLLGRGQEVFFRDGKNYFLNDIDSVVEQLSFIRAGGCASVVDPYSKFSEDDVVVFVDIVARDDNERESRIAEVQRHLSKTVGVHLSHIVPLSRRHFKKTTSGKLKRQAIYEEYAELNTSNTNSSISSKSKQEPADSQFEQLVSSVWAEVLSCPVESTDWHTPFRDLGGSSLKAVQIHNLLENELGIPLDPNWLITKNTIFEMAEALRSEGHSLRSASEPTPRRAVPSHQKSIPSVVSEDNAIAVVAVSLRYPGASNLQELGQLLLQGRFSFDYLSQKRWALIAGSSDTLIDGNRPYGSFLNEIETFDYKYFGFSKEQAVAMDPQGRLFLAMAREALGRTRLHSRKVGIFGSSGDYEYASLINPNSYSANTLNGSLQNMLAAQISRTLQLSGPALTINTACSSSLYALHLASQSLKSGESDIALAGGVQINLTENGFRSFNAAGLLKQGAPSTPFGRGKSGLVPGEGGAIVVLKRLKDAIAHNDQVLGVIRASSVNNDGPSLSGTAPNPQGQIDLIRGLYEKEKLQLSDLDYFEAHAAGTAIGDSIEVHALNSVREQMNDVNDTIVPIGSAKSNFGHTLSASGITSFVKVIASLDQETIPATIINGGLSDRVDFPSLGFVPTQNQLPWSKGAKTRRAGISSLGLGGTNVHVIVEDFPSAAQHVQATSPAPVQIVSVGGSTEKHISLRCEQIIAAGDRDLLTATLLDDQFAQKRYLLWGDNQKELLAKLRRFTPNNDIKRQTKPKIAFVFPGPGSQFHNMGRIFYDSFPVFREAIDRCHQILKSYDISLLHLIYEASYERELHKIEYSQPVVFAFSYAMSQLVRTLGIKPDILIGHSAGEYAAAVAGGILSLEEGVRCIVKRGQLMAEAPKGAMAVVHASESEVQKLIQPLGKDLTIAAHNSPHQITVSGSIEAIDLFVRRCEEMDFDASKLDIGCAAHSSYMIPAAEQLKHYLKDISFESAKTPVLSTCNLNLMREFSPSYLAEQLHRPVLFQDAITKASHLKIDVFLELSPTSGLSFCISKILSGKSQLQIKSLGLRGQMNLEHTLKTFNHLYQLGIDLELDSLLGLSANRQHLPPNTFKESCWINPYRREVKASTPGVYQLDQQDLIYAEDHLIQGKASAPFGVLMDILAHDQHLLDQNCFKNIVFLSSLFTAEGTQLRVNRKDQDVVLKLTGSQDKELVLAEVAQSLPIVYSNIDLDLIKSRLRVEKDVDSLYERRHTSGLAIGPSLRAIEQIFASEREALIKLASPDSNQPGRIVQAALIDAAMQATSVFFESEDNNNLYLGFGIESWNIYSPVQGECFVYIRLKERSINQDVFKFDMIFCSDNGKVLSEINDFSAKKVETTESKDSSILHPISSQKGQEIPTPENTSLEIIMKRIFATALKRDADEIDSDELFTNMGINSIKAVKIAGNIQEQFKVRLPATLLFEAPNIKALGELLEKRLK